MNKRTLLMILDGWGIGKHDKADAVFQGETPYIDNLLNTYPNSQLKTYGENVGLPDGQMGNSEVGHMNIGAGRIVYQDLVRINKAVADNSIAENPVLKEAFEYAQKNKKAVHFLGLVSNGGVHSSQEHLYKLCDLTQDYNLPDVFIHAITDGRDTDPRSGKQFIQKLENHLKTSNGKIATLIGRYFTMDRDKRWDRIKKGYDLMTAGIGNKNTNVLDAVEDSYKAGKTDEFIEPVVLTDENNKPLGLIKEEDVVICFNFRTDRCREITMALTQQNFPDHKMKTIPLHYVTMTNYDSTFSEINVVFEKDNLKMTIGEVLSKAGKSQIRIAETEKYAHVTFFFSGGREALFENERRILINSPKVATYDLQPEMSAPEVTDKLCEALQKEDTDFVCLNFANSDMVGHTGIYKSIIQAVETIDSCVQRVVETGKSHGYSFIIIADHGNSDYAINKDGTPNTAHSLNPVPCIVIDKNYMFVKDGDRKSTRLNSSHTDISRMPSSA